MKTTTNATSPLDTISYISELLAEAEHNEPATTTAARFVAFDASSAQALINWGRMQGANLTAHSLDTSRGYWSLEFSQSFDYSNCFMCFAAVS